MYENYGDVVLFDGNDTFSQAIRRFNRQQYVHSGLLIEDGVASQLNKWGKEVFIDILDSKDHDNCLILTYKGMIPEKRKLLKFHYENLLSTH